LGNTAGSANAHMNIGLVYDSMGNDIQALEHYRKSLALSEVGGWKVLIANALDKIGDVYNTKADYEQALSYATRSLKLNEEIQNSRQTIFSVLTQGNIYHRHGDQ